MSIQRMEDMVKELTKLRPERLQQFAAEHQNDTYALLAAKAASEEQKKIMAARQPQQMGMPPKVNEQVVASIAQPQAPQAAPQDQGLPEDSGIAQLPAPNMQGLAGGGIVAFSTGGINDGSQYLRSTDGGRTWSVDAPDMVRNPTKPYYSEVANPAAVLKGRTFGSRDEAASAYRAAMTSGTPEVSSVRAIDTAIMPAAAVNTPTLAAPASNAAPAPASAPAPAGPKLKLDGSGAGTGGGAGSSDTGGSLTSLLKKIQAAQGEPTDPEADARKQLQASAEAMAGKELTNAQASKEGLAALLGGKESRIKGREDRAEKAENLNAKMAVINAGLAMMQSTGKGLAGIAEGATKGMGMYNEGLKLTAAERQKIEDAKDSFDDLRFNSENLSRKEITALENKITNAANITLEASMGARNKERENKREDSGKIFTAEAAARQGELNRAAQLQPSGQMQLALALGKGDVEAGMRKITEIAAGKFSIQQAYADHLKAAGPGMGMTPQDFAAAMRAFTPPKPTTKPSGTAFD